LHNALKGFIATAIVNPSIINMNQYKESIMKNPFLTFIPLLLVLTGCGNTFEPENPSLPDAILITLADNASSAHNSPDVEITGSAVTIKAAGAYVLSGTLTDGTVKVDADGDAALTFKGVHIASNSGPPFAVFGTGEKTITLAENTQNTLNNTAPLTEETEEFTAALYAGQALTIQGGGGLTVTGEYGNGIACADTLVIENVKLAITAKQNGITASERVLVKGSGTELHIQTDGGFDAAAGFKETYTLNGIACDGSVIIEEGVVTVSSASGGINVGNTAGDIVISGGTVTVQSNGNAIHSDGLARIDGGIVSIPDCFEGIEAFQVIINDGAISIAAYDDGINLNITENNPAPQAECRVIMNGGALDITCTAGDCIDALADSGIGEFFLYGGSIHAVSRSKTALHSAAGIHLNGGTITAFSQVSDAVSPDSRQCVFILKQTQSAAAKVTLRRSDEQIAAESDSDVPFKTLIISVPGLEKGQTYSVYSEDIVTASITLSETVTIYNF
jgi:hypothetical protein